MANLKEIRNRISSVSSTMKITSAMKMVSAAKLRQSQNAIMSFRPYSNKLKNLNGLILIYFIKGNTGLIVFCGETSCQLFEYQN